MKVLHKLGPVDHPNLLAGHAGAEDAGVYRLDDERALVQTLDFFGPIADDPRWFGRIAAANALSDVYAMGGVPLTAMNIVGWPAELDEEVLGEVLAGGMDKINEAGAALCGGHSVRDQEVKYGLSVTGLVHPDKFWRNGGAREGDVLVLTKPLGMGAVSTAIKKGLAPGDLERRAMEQMATLNKAAAEHASGSDVHSCTDVTGFGLAGHGLEVADNSGLTLEIESANVPLIEGVHALAAQGLCSGGSKRGRAHLEPVIDIRGDADPARVAIFFDAETSGGLLIALPEAEAAALVARLRGEGIDAGIAGSFAARGSHGVVIR